MKLFVMNNTPLTVSYVAQPGLTSLCSLGPPELEAALLWARITGVKPSAYTTYTREKTTKYQHATKAQGWFAISK